MSGFCAQPTLLRSHQMASRLRGFTFSASHRILCTITGAGRAPRPLKRSPRNFSPQAAALRNTAPDMNTPMLVLGMLALMPGIGFILSAGATWIVAKRLGLLPEKQEISGAQPAHINPIDRP